MCGIVGQFNTQIPLAKLEAARDLLKHRGPDDAGMFVDGPVGFGFRRLSILDLSPAGHQPMSSADGTCTIIFNGEIYNFRELKTELEAAGKKFRTQSDTEVILAAYQAWGLGCFARFNGMWAMAIWDRAKQRLVLSRDRFGEKPLYYQSYNGGTIFASEMKALLHLTGQTPPPNDRIVFDYLVYGFHDHTDQTFFSGIHQLLPGHLAVITTTGLSLQRYWQLEPKLSGIKTIDQAADKFRELLTDSIRLRLRSDVPIGSCLSGGLDSSTIVITAAEIAKRESTQLQHKTFTASSTDPKFDERQYSRLVNKLVGAEGYEVFPDPEEFRRVFDQLLWHQEEPFLSMSMFAQWEVMRTAKQAGVTVLLDGQGGDEVLAGYIPFFASWFAQLIRQGRWTTFVKELRPFMNTHRRSIKDILPTFALYLLPASIGRQLLRTSGRLEIQALDSEFRRQNFQYPDLPNPFPNQFKNHLYRLLTGPGLRSLLHSEDRNSMAFSLEARVPFLDHRLPEFTLGLPDELLLQQAETKRLLRKAFHQTLPPAIRDRKDKMGFVVSQASWMRGALAADVKAALTGKTPRIAKYLDPEHVSRSTQAFLGGQDLPLATIWRWYNLESWLRRFYG